MIKRFLIVFVIISTLTLAILPVTNSAHAVESFTGGCREILGLTSWDCDVNISDQESLVSGIITIAANIFKDITVIAAYLILGYVIYGGYQYTFSGGDPGKIANGKKTLTHGFIGLAIVLSANVILNTIRIAIGANFTESCATQQCVDPTEMVTNAIQWVIGIAGTVSVIFVVYGGILYVTSSGDPNKAQRARNMIMYALIGLAVVALAEIITAFVTNIINNAVDGENAYYLNSSYQQTISKEVHEHKTL